LVITRFDYQRPGREAVEAGFGSLLPKRSWSDLALGA
jgi:hypothetical protein